jgi:hypothetical protein
VKVLTRLVEHQYELESPLWHAHAYYLDAASQMYGPLARVYTDEAEGEVTIMEEYSRGGADNASDPVDR